MITLRDIRKFELEMEFLDSRQTEIACRRHITIYLSMASRDGTYNVMWGPYCIE